MGKGKGAVSVETRQLENGTQRLLEQRQQEVKFLGGPVSPVTKFLTKLRIIVEMSEEARVLKTALPPPLCDQGGQVTMIVFASIAGLYF